MLGSALRKALTVVPLSDGQAPRTLVPSWSTASGVRVSANRALTASAVYGATTLTADTMAAMPVRFLDESDDSRLPVSPANLTALTGRKANALQTRVDLIQTVYLSMLLHGEALLFPRRTNGGDVFELWPIDPDRITEVERLDGQGGSIGLRFRMEGWDKNNGWVENRPGKDVQMVHVPMHVLPGQIRGISPIKQMAELVGMSLSAQEHAARFLGDGVHMTGTIETAADLAEPEAKELWENFQRMHAGPSRAGRVGLLTGGATFKTVAIPPKELQFLEQMKLSDNRIATTVYRVPPHLMGDVERSTSWGTGIEEQTHNWVKFRLLNLARKVESQIEAAFLPEDVTMRFTMNGLLRGVARDRAAFYRVLWNMGVLNQDEIRGLEDMPPLPDGKGSEYRIPLNTAPIGEDESGRVLEEMSARFDLLDELVKGGR